VFVNLIPLLSLSGSAFVRNRGLKGEGGNTTCCRAQCFPRAFPLALVGGESIRHHQAHRSSAATDTRRDGSSAGDFALKLSGGLGNAGLRARSSLQRVAVEFLTLGVLKGRQGTGYTRPVRSWGNANLLNPSPFHPQL